MWILEKTYKVFIKLITTTMGCRIFFYSTYCLIYVPCRKRLLRDLGFSKGVGISLLECRLVVHAADLCTRPVPVSLPERSYWFFWLLSHDVPIPSMFLEFKER